MMFRRLAPAAGPLAALLLLVAPLAARAEEVITRFHSAIRVEPSGEMQVTETIEVNAEGNRIRHGIFRDFPLTFLDKAGQTAHVDFTLEDVKRDGAPEASKTETIDNGIRIYAGSADTEVKPGHHTYEFRYRTDRQIRFFDDHDELYWNVTGNYWQFRILSATVDADLPGPVDPSKITFFTGAYGSTQRDARVLSASGNHVTIATTEPLGAQEGLSIVVSQPKGAIAEPTSDKRMHWFITDNLGAIIGWTGFVVMFTYYYRSWSKVGRDPPKGVAVPRWDPPGGLSPALINYVDNKGFSGEGWTAFSASALQLAVKGYITLEDLDAQIVLKRTTKAVEGPLPKGEDVLVGTIERQGGIFRIDRDHGSTVQTTASSFRSAIEKEHRGKYYQHNWGYSAGGVVLSILFLAAAFLLSHPSEEIITAGAVLMIAAVVGGIMIGNISRGLMSPGRSVFAKVVQVIALTFVGFVAFSMISGVLIGVLASGASLGGMPFLTSLGAIVLLNVLFIFLMGAPTPIGRNLMDGIDGFRTYMTLAEKDRLNMAGAPKMSPAHFETLLPYAVALGVEKPWSEAFERWLVTAAAAGAVAGAYHPGWYSGNAFDTGRLSRFPSSMASTIASTIPAPKSSSSSSGFSSGGGFSGGGGGGGGGGGW